VAEYRLGEPTASWTPLFDTGVLEAQPITATEPPTENPSEPPTENPSEPLPTFVAPEVVPGTDQYLKRWHFVLVVTGVWTVAAVIGLALFEWWFQSVDKTGPVFVVLIDLVICTVAGLLVAMVQNKPLVSAVAIALLSAPLASAGAAAALYGAYVFQWIDR
jgi:hypothetical protein